VFGTSISPSNESCDTSSLRSVLSDQCQLRKRDYHPRQVLLDCYCTVLSAVTLVPAWRAPIMPSLSNNVHTGPLSAHFSVLLALFRTLPAQAHHRAGPMETQIWISPTTAVGLVYCMGTGVRHGMSQPNRTSPQLATSLFSWHFLLRSPRTVLVPWVLMTSSEFDVDAWRNAADAGTFSRFQSCDQRTVRGIIAAGALDGTSSHQYCVVPSAPVPSPSFICVSFSLSRCHGRVCRIKTGVAMFFFCAWPRFPRSFRAFLCGLAPRQKATSRSHHPNLGIPMFMCSTSAASLQIVCGCLLLLLQFQWRVARCSLGASVIPPGGSMRRP
jgi:hypothetical protein